MTTRQAWLAIGKAFERYYETGKKHYSFEQYPGSYGTNGLCYAARSFRGLTVVQHKQMKKQLRSIRRCDSYWFKCSPEEAGKRALVAYFLAAGMDPR